MFRYEQARSAVAALIAAIVIGSGIVPMTSRGETSATSAGDPLQPQNTATPTDSPTGPFFAQSAEQLEKAVRELQAEWNTTRGAVEQLHRSMESEARQQAEQLNHELGRLERELETQKREREQVLKMVEAANQQTLIYAVLFTGISLISIVVVSLMQIRATTKLTALAVNYADRLNLHALPSVPNQMPSSPEAEHLLKSLDRLQQRIEELESTAFRGLIPSSEKSPRGKNIPDVPGSGGALTPESELAKPQTQAPASPTIHSNPNREGRAEQEVGEKASPTALIAGILGKGEVLLKMGQARPALTAFEEALRLEGNHVEAWVKKGSALEKLDRMEEALACYNQAIALDCSSTLAYLYKGGVCNRLERFDEALACYEQALKSHDKRGDAAADPHV